MNFMNDPIIAARMRTLMQQQSVQQEQPNSTIDTASTDDLAVDAASSSESNIDSLMSAQTAQHDIMMTRRQMMHNSRTMYPPSELIPNNLPTLPPMRGQWCGTMAPRPYPSMPPQFGGQTSNSGPQNLPAQAVNPWFLQQFGNTSPGNSGPLPPHLNPSPVPAYGNYGSGNTLPSGNIPQSLDDLSALYNGNLSAQIFKDLGRNSIPKSILAFEAASQADMRYHNNQFNEQMNNENTNGGYGLIGLINKISGSYNNYGSGASSYSNTSNYSNMMENAGYGNSASNMNNNTYDYASMF